MKSVLLLAVNRHQEAYFRTLSQSSNSDLSIKSVHKNQLPFFVLPTLVSSEESGMLFNVVDSRFRTTRQGAPSFYISPWRSLVLRSVFWIGAYFFLLRIKKYLNSQDFDLVGLWNGLKWHQQIIQFVVKKQEKRTLFFENGPFPDTTAVDARGVNCLSSIPQDPKAFFDYDDKQAGLPLATSCSSQTNIAQGLSEPLLDRLNNRQYIFVPFQVDSDTQIVEHSPWIKNMAHVYELLCRVVSKLDTDLIFLVKEHPSAKRSYKHLHEKDDRVVFCNDECTNRLVDSSVGVLTINSTVGFESIRRGKPVICMGNAFYQVPGLAKRVDNESELQNACAKLHFHNLSSELYPELQEVFLAYVRSEYVVEGNWREPTNQHVLHVQEKINKTLGTL